MKIILILFLSILASSCVFYGSGTRTITGEITGGSNVKIGLFPPSDTFSYDVYTPGDTDKVFDDNTTDTFTPVTDPQPVSPGADNSFTITFPVDPSTVKTLLAWNDLNSNDIYDMATEAAYFPVKTIGGTGYVVTGFTYIETVEVITYIVHYTDTSYTYTYNDNFDAIGASGFNFTFD